MKISKIMTLSALSLIFIVQQAKAVVTFEITNASGSNLEISDVIVKPGAKIMVSSPPIVIRLKGGTPQDYIFIKCTDAACTKFTDEKSGALTSNCDFNYMLRFSNPTCSIYKN